MKSTALLSAFAITALVTALDASASQSTEALLAARQRLAVAAQRTKGLHRAEIDWQRLHLIRLIDELERGERVQMAEIAESLLRAIRTAR